MGIAFQNLRRGLIGVGSHRETGRSLEFGLEQRANRRALGAEGGFSFSPASAPRPSLSRKGRC